MSSQPSSPSTNPCKGMGLSLARTIHPGWNPCSFFTIRPWLNGPFLNGSRARRMTKEDLRETPVTMSMKKPSLEEPLKELRSNQAPSRSSGSCSCPKGCQLVETSWLRGSLLSEPLNSGFWLRPVGFEWCFHHTIHSTGLSAPCPPRFNDLRQT